jgi:hypothetical protein
VVSEERGRRQLAPGHAARRSKSIAAHRYEAAPRKRSHNLPRGNILPASRLLFKEGDPIHPEEYCPWALPESTQKGSSPFPRNGGGASLLLATLHADRNPSQPIDEIFCRHPDCSSKKVTRYTQKSIVRGHYRREHSLEFNPLSDPIGCSSTPCTRTMVPRFFRVMVATLVFFLLASTLRIP